MTRITLAAALLVALSANSLAKPDGNFPPVEPYERAGFITNMSSESILWTPFVFREGTWIQLDTDDEGNLLICVAGHGMGDCVFTHEPPGNLVSASLIPNCQGDGTIAFTFEVLRDPEPDILVYFVDGWATFDRDEAETWANETPGCTFDTIDEEW